MFMVATLRKVRIFMSEVENNLYAIEDEKLLKTSHPYSYHYVKRLAGKYRVKRVGRSGIFINDATLIQKILAADTFEQIDWLTQYRGFRSPLFGTTGLHPNLSPETLKKISDIDMAGFSGLIQVGVSEYFDQLDDELTIDTYVDIVEWSDRLNLELLCYLLGVPRNVDYANRKNSIKNIFNNIKTLTGPITKRSERQFAEAELNDFSDLISASYRYSSNSIPSWFKTNGFTLQETKDIILTLSLTVVETLRPLLPRITSLLVETEHLKYVNEHDLISETALAEIFRMTCPVPVTVLKATENYELDSFLIKAGETVVLVSKFAAQRVGNFDLFRQNQQSIYDYCFGNLDTLSKTMIIDVANKLMSVLQEVDQAHPLNVRAKSINHISLNGEYKNLNLEAH